MILADTNVLVAAAFRRDANHQAALSFLQELDDEIGVLPTVVAETGYLLESKIGPEAEATFLESFEEGDFELVDLQAGDLSRMADLVRRYASLGLGSTDASLVAVAERLGITMIASYDNHFRIVSPRHVDAFTLLPEDLAH